MLRDPCDEFTSPRVGPSPVVGALSIGVFVKLIASARSSTFWRSVIEKSFDTLRSAVCIPGPLMIPTPQFPNPEVGWTKVLVFHH